MVLRLYDSKEASKMDAKVAWEVDVEGAVGAVDMLDSGEVGMGR